MLHARRREAEPEEALFGHPANPHQKCTNQGDQDCWSEVAQRYGGHAEWQLQTPSVAARSSIACRILGVPFGGTTRPPSNADRAESYIPIAAWKPHWHVRLVTRTGACPSLIVRVTRNGTRLSTRASRSRRAMAARSSRAAPPRYHGGRRHHRPWGDFTQRRARRRFSQRIGDLRTVQLWPDGDDRLVRLAARDRPADSRPAVRHPGHVHDSGVGLSIDPSPREPLAPPVITVHREGELEPFDARCPRRRRRTGARDLCRRSGSEGRRPDDPLR